MARLRALGTFVTIMAALSAFSCDSDEPEKNPSFTAGDAGSPAGGEPSDLGDAGRDQGQGNAGANPSAGAGGQATAGSPAELAGAGGNGPEEPPYDCVLHPTTHLEIINACTDAQRIEKHPNLPPIQK